MSRDRISKKAGWVDPDKLSRGPNGRALCRWCALEVPKNRRTFCGAACVHEHKIRTQPVYVRACLDKRDLGVCCSCGLDTVAAAKQFWSERPKGDTRAPLAAEPRHLGERAMLRATCGNALPGRSADRPWGRWAEQFRQKLGAYPWDRRRGRFWDADHVQPVAEDGGGCDLDNYQTLCLLCHKAKTTEQKQRAAVVKRLQQSQQEIKMSKEKPTPKEMQQTLKSWMTDEANKPMRLVSATKLKEVARAMDPGIRMDSEVHAALCRELVMMIKRAMQRCYDNKRSTIRPLDL